MKKKIYLSPSNQTANVGCYAAYKMNECLACTKISDEVAKYLLNNYDCEVKTARQADNLSIRCAEANNWGFDAYLAIHTNATTISPTIHGTEIYVKSGDGASKAYAQKILSNVVALSKSSRGVKQTSALYECNCPKGVHALIEVDFHTCPEQTKWLVEDYVAIGQAIAKGIAESINLDSKPVEEPETNLVLDAEPTLTVEPKVESKIEAPTQTTTPNTEQSTIIDEAFIKENINLILKAIADKFNV